ncbi:halocyanin domain-containing protein [Halohasta salina]|uniref:halocyanin domain-containing protein n=1 Tax=Halohasta salina TaxID=2961621 RepID=UPI0020A3AC5C|nr:halocyanin domain-containing protein [Halohasta salina]
MSERSSRRSVLAGIAVVATAGCLGGSEADLESDTYGDWFRGANNFAGTVDRTDRSAVTVDVGAGDGFAFDPAAIRVSVGTTVRWEWTGRGGQHNVVEEDGVFESEYYFDEGETFSHTFGEPGVYRYVCTPHQTQGMLGAVEVVE